MIRRKISPMYRPAIIFSKACWPGRGESLSTMMSYLVRGRTLCSLSKAPHSQLIAMGVSGGRFMWASLGMEPQFSM